MTTEIHTTARARFEEWADIKSPHLPADPIDAMQVRLLRWEQAQPFWRVSSLPVALGCGEEAGDARDAFLATAEQVLARNWTANPVTGAATP